MKSITYKILGIVLIILGLIGIIFFSFFGMLQHTIRICFLGGHGGDCWMLFYVAVPLLFLIMGIYYSAIGFKNLQVNKIISSSAIFQIIALITAILGFLITLIVCLINPADGYCALLSIPFAGLAAVISATGFILFLLGLIVGERELNKWAVIGITAATLIIIGLIAFLLIWSG